MLQRDVVRGWREGSHQGQANVPLHPSTRLLRWRGLGLLRELPLGPRGVAGRALFLQGVFGLRKAASVPQFPH